MKSLLEQRAYFFLTLLISSSVAGCGGKGSTKLSYSAPIVPIGISFAVDSDGAVSVAGGIATPVGTFAIEHSFPTRQEMNYIVFRNRRLGTDQVFKIGTDGHVDLHLQGEHNLRITRDGRAFVIDADTISGRIDVSVTPSGSAVARVDWGANKPDFVITSSRHLLIEYPSMFVRTEKIPLDTIETLELHNSWPSGEYSLRLHKKIKSETTRPILFLGKDRNLVHANWSALKASIDHLGNPPRFVTRQNSWGMPLGFGLLGLTSTSCIFVGHRTRDNSTKGLCWFIGIFCGVIILGVTSSLGLI